MDAGTAELLERVGELAEPGRRQEAASALARLLGAEGLLLFAPDPEMGVPLPAPGLSQVLRGAGEWRVFLEACARQGVPAGLHVFSIDDAKRRIAEGWRFIAVNSELKFMLQGASDLAKQIHPELVSGELAKY